MLKRCLMVGLKNGLVVSMLASSATHAAEFSAETLKAVGPVEAYWVTNVTCDNGDSAGEIRRKTDGNEWCATGIDGYCAASKAEAATKVCSAEFMAAKNELAEKEEAEKELQRANERAEQERKRELEARQQAERERQAALARAQAEKDRAAEGDRQKKIEIDEKLLQIEQEKLSLRRQELELQRRAVQIREALESLDAG